MCDPCSEREPGTGRLRREQAPVPCTPAMASDHRQSREHATTQRPGPHEDPLTASSGRPSEERVTGDQEGSRCLISPSRRMFSSAPVRGLSFWCLRVSPKSTSAQQCPACACGQKTILRAPRWRSSRGTAPNRKSRPAAQRTGGHRGVATRKTTGDLTTRRGAGDPVRRAEWMTVFRYGHLRSAPVVVNAVYAGSGNRLHSLQRSHALWRFPDGLPPLCRCTNASAHPREQAITVVRAEGSEVSRRPVQKIAELASNSWRFPQLRLLIRPRGLWVAALPCPGGQVAPCGRLHNSISHHELITECIFPGVWHQITKAVLPSRAVGVTVPPCFSRATARVQWTQRSCLKLVFRCNSICIEIAESLRPKGCRRRCATLSRLLGEGGSLRLHRLTLLKIILSSPTGSASDFSVCRLAVQSNSVVSSLLSQLPQG